MLLSEIPNIENRWSESNVLKPEEISHTSRDFFEILCLKCQQFSQRRAKDIHNRPESCGICSGKTVIPGVNDALTFIPELSEIWDYDLNTKSPEEYSKSSGAKVWIKCADCKQSNQRTIANVSTNIKGCVVCSGKKIVIGINDLTSSFLYKEWSPKNTLNPEKLTSKSWEEVLWICDLGHEYKMAPGTRVGLQRNCPYCSSQKVFKGFNDLATVRPELLVEWDYSKNEITPHDLTAGSNKQVWWLCKSEHSIFISPNQKWDSKRERLRICKDCLRGIQSYGEKEVLEFLQKEGFNVESSVRGVLSKGEIDCYIADLKFGVEFNGDYWHSDKVVYEKHSITAREYHERKLKSAKNNGITLLFVWASDWYADTDKMKRLILDVIQNRTDIDPILQILSKG